MPSDEFYEDLSRWIDGELPPERHAQVTAHLKSCTTCRETLREFTQLSAVLRGMAVSDVPAYVTDNAMRLVRAQARAEGKSRWPHIFPALFDLKLLKVGMCVTAVLVAVYSLSWSAVGTQFRPQCRSRMWCLLFPRLRNPGLIRQR